VKTERATIAISGLGVGRRDAIAIERTVPRARGAGRVVVSPRTEVTYVEYDPDVIGPADLVRIVEELGLSVEGPAIRR
jgi:copper chaperone CopZ